MKFDKAFIDTSVILRLLVKDDSVKARSAFPLIKTAGEKGLALYLPSVIILELCASFGFLKLIFFMSLKLFCTIPLNIRTIL